MKAMNMMSYKEDLDNQMKQRRAFQMYGNMSKQEKAINKDDLIAYKNYDNNQYALIPGFASQKAMPLLREKKESPVNQGGKGFSLSKEQQLKNSVDRLAGYGFTHLGASGSAKALDGVKTRPDIIKSVDRA